MSAADFAETNTFPTASAFEHTSQGNLGMDRLSQSRFARAASLVAGVMGVGIYLSTPAEAAPAGHGVLYAAELSEPTVSATVPIKPHFQRTDGTIDVKIGDTNTDPTQTDQFTVRVGDLDNPQQYVKVKTMSEQGGETKDVLFGGVGKGNYSVRVMEQGLDTNTQSVIEDITVHERKTLNVKGRIIRNIVDRKFIDETINNTRSNVNARLRSVVSVGQRHSIHRFYALREDGTSQEYNVPHHTRNGRVLPVSVKLQYRANGSWHLLDSHSFFKH